MGRRKGSKNRPKQATVERTVETKSTDIAVVEPGADIAVATGDNEIQEWATLINQKHGDEIAAILAKGNALIESKVRLGHGRWGRMFAEDKNAVSEPVRFGVRMAEIYMAIVKSKILSNPKRISHLPTAVSVLSELATLDKKVLTAAFNNGEITPDLRRQDVVALRKSMEPEPEPKESTPEEQVKVEMRDEARHFVRDLSKEPVIIDMTEQPASDTPFNAFVNASPAEAPTEFTDLASEMLALMDNDELFFDKNDPTLAVAGIPERDRAQALKRVDNLF